MTSRGQRSAAPPDHTPPSPTDPVSGARAHPHARLLIAAALCLGAVGTVLLAAAAGYRLNVQTSSVDMPPPAAGPAAVVRSYIAAYNARDLATVHAIFPGQTSATRRFSALGRFSDLATAAPRYDDGSNLGSPAGPDPDHGRVYVPVTMTAHGMNDSDLTEGPLRWGFFLERASSSEHWRIVDQGVG